MALNSYAEVQQFIAAVLTQDGENAAGAPHGAFWSTLSYEEFVTGNVPNVGDCNSGNPMPLLVKGNSQASNIIHALRGTPGTCFDPNNNNGYGQMPASGPPFLRMIRFSKWRIGLTLAVRSLRQQLLGLPCIALQSSKRW